MVLLLQNMSAFTWLQYLHGIHTAGVVCLHLHGTQTAGVVDMQQDYVDIQQDYDDATVLFLCTTKMMQQYHFVCTHSYTLMGIVYAKKKIT